MAAITCTRFTDEYQLFEELGNSSSALVLTSCSSCLLQTVRYLIAQYLSKVHQSQPALPQYYKKGADPNWLPLLKAQLPLSLAAHARQPESLT
ncbi:hypothetical protein SKAU_G00365630 [Synaphobranchus kaupii]|uniref:Uncharacterized protein n=1 Tax=Synaphobranchus kaupii TaxID=118154 RepID=A0A9Q1EF18_SYNKA|nr:hypothetical protein SKAU_G00365630 [Synaphobranchus kaupii]